MKSLTERYAEPHRHYHTWEHIERMMYHVYNIVPWPSADLILAIMYHDAVYDPMSKTNEEDSAALLPESEVIARNLILGTKNHTADTLDGKILNDLDLWILGAPSSLFDKYCEQIREEYIHVPDAFYYYSRGKILKDFADKPFIFTTEKFRDWVELSARRNIERELEKSMYNDLSTR